VALSLVTTVLALGLTGAALRSRNHETDGRRDALAAARQYAVDLTTYDFSTVDDDFARFSRHGTKAFQASYAATIAAAKPKIVKAQSRALGTVVGAGLESYGDGRASVLLAVDQETRRAGQAGPSVERSRIRMRLQHVGNGWLVTAVNVF
jgi:Mce-associated membrane protein